MSCHEKKDMLQFGRSDVSNNSRICKGITNRKRGIVALNQFIRTEALLGKEAMKRLADSRIAVFGIGGVGGYVVEALARSGVGALDLIDNDKVDLSNLNRQIIASRDTLGRYKTEIMQERILAIHPDCRVEVHQCFYLPETKDQFDFRQYDYVVDAIDTVTGKIQLVLQAQEAEVPMISSMGTGNKLNPAELEVADIYQTSVCPLARVMRRELKKLGVSHLKVVYSKEKPIQTAMHLDAENASETDGNTGRRPVPASAVFVPAAAGMLIASEVVKDLTHY